MKKAILFISAFFTILSCSAQSFNFDQGIKAFNENNTDQALIYFTRELNDNPNNSLAYFYRAVIYHYNETYANALSDINNSIKHSNKKNKELLAGAYKLRGDIYVEIESIEKAFEDFATAIKLTPDDLDLYIDRAQVYFDLRKYETAESDYRYVLKKDEGDVRGWAGLGRNYLAQKKYKDAEETLNKLIKLSPDYTGGYYYRSLVAFDQKKYDDAINDMFTCFLLDETDQQVRNLFISYSEKNPSLALSKVNAQIASQPEKEIWYFIRALLYEEKFDYIAAIKDYTKLMELTRMNDKSSLLSYRAECYSNAGMYEQSIADYTLAISFDSTDAYYFGYRGDAKRLLGDYASAKEDFTKAITIEPREAWFYYRRGWIEEEFLKNYTAGLKDYNEAIAINKGYAYTYLHRGRLFETKLNNSLKAKEDYTTILSLDTIVSKAGNCRHYALFHLGHVNAATTWVNKMIEQYPTSGNYYDAACLYSLMNNPKEALVNMELAFQGGYRDFIHLENDDDLDNIRNLPEFKNLVSEWENVFDESLQSDIVVKKDTVINSETVSIPMKAWGVGTYEVACKINELNLNLIFDTGASDISISQTEVQFMLKNGYLKPNDFVGTHRYMDANGDIEIGTTVILRKVDIGGLILKNISASVVHRNNAPLLFGQSALSKYGKIIIDNENKIITITTMTTTSK